MAKRSNILSQEKRKYPRFPFKRRLTILAESPQLKKTIEYDASGINLSRGGILLESRADFAEGTGCVVTFLDFADSQVKKDGTIRRVEAPEGMSLPEAVRLYGIEFEKQLEEVELKSMVGASES
ncbi:MAG: PilZ domain-containing protein [Leptospiraceae bacterium]|nr:PilZ domain-containing protein [Leptospiraceae bacterium]